MRALARSCLSGRPNYFAQSEIKPSRPNRAAPILRGASSRSGLWLVRACQEVLATLRSVMLARSSFAGNPNDFAQ
eukprot:3453032-Alexandrium_andersonii.AAC.1